MQNSDVITVRIGCLESPNFQFIFYHENINLHVCHSNHISFVSDLLKVIFYVENLKIKYVLFKHWIIIIFFFVKCGLLTAMVCAYKLKKKWITRASSIARYENLLDIKFYVHKN